MSSTKPKTTPATPIITQRDGVSPYTTLDGSQIRELFHPALHGNQAQSLAEASLPAGAQTRLHRHHRSEEIYHVLAGEGMMQLGEARFAIRPGDSICITPGCAHALENTGKETLRLLCCCSPAYAHDDTELLE
jgi:mannose-6-phosphate isomerase-like protein (cupin superfamily)